MNDVLGTIFYSILVYGLGALTGVPLYTWLKGMLPWSKK
jgi:hypothetical protein